MVEAFVALHHVARPADQVRRLLDVAQRLQPVLANLHGQKRAELHLAIADRVGGTAQEGHPLVPGPPAPSRKRRPCRGDRVANILPGAPGERAHDGAVDGRALLERAVAVPSSSARTLARPASNWACSWSLSLRSVA